MSKLNQVQKIARLVGVKSGRNTYFNPDINDPDNQSVKLNKNTVIALGCVNIRHIPDITKEKVKPHFSNTFALAIDEVLKTRK